MSFLGELVDFTTGVYETIANPTKAAKKQAKQAQAALTPDLPPLPAAPTVEDRAVQEAAAETARRRQRARGFRSTILARDFLEPASPARQTTLGS